MKYIRYQVKDRVGIITLNRPDKRNALSFELVSELKAAFAEAESDLGVKVVVLEAAGEVFCSGADLESLQQLQHNSYEENLQDSRHLKELLLQIYRLKKVVIAKVQGHAIAGGCGLAAVCDFVFSVPEAKFGYTEVRIGFVPAIVTVFLLRKIGEQKAKQWLLGGELMKGNEARTFGIVNFVVDADQLEQAVTAFAHKLIKENSGQSMELTKTLMARVQEMPLDQALEHAAAINAQARATEDCKKGVQAFLNKKDITW